MPRHQAAAPEVSAAPGDGMDVIEKTQDLWDYDPLAKGSGQLVCWAPDTQSDERVPEV